LILLPALAGEEGVDAGLDVLHTHPVVGNRHSEQLLPRSVVAVALAVAAPRLSASLSALPVFCDEGLNDDPDPLLLYLLLLLLRARASLPRPLPSRLRCERGRRRWRSAVATVVAGVHGVVDELLDDLAQGVAVGLPAPEPAQRRVGPEGSQGHDLAA
jgi:hypothetical protein